MPLSAETLIFVRRTAVVWALVRLTYAFLGYLRGGLRDAGRAAPPPGSDGSPGIFAAAAVLSAVVLTAVTATLALVDLRMARERILFANLGVSRTHVAAVAVATAAVLEAALRLVLR